MKDYELEMDWMGLRDLDVEEGIWWYALDQTLGMNHLVWAT